MRAFLVLSCAVCLAVARPQTGYNYEPNYGYQRQYYSSPLIQRGQSLPSVPSYAQTELPNFQNFQNFQHFQSLPTASARLEQPSFAAQSQYLQPLSTAAAPYEQQSLSAQSQYVQSPPSAASPLQQSPLVEQSQYLQPLPTAAAPLEQSSYAAQSQYLQPLPTAAAPLQQSPFVAQNQFLPTLRTAAAPLEQTSFAAHNPFLALPSASPYLSHGAYASQHTFFGQHAYAQPTAPAFPTNFNGFTGFNAPTTHAEAPIATAAANIPQSPLNTAAPINELHAATQNPTELAPQEHFAGQVAQQLSEDDAKALAAPTQPTPLVKTETFAPSPTEIAPLEPTDQKVNSDSISVEVPDTPSTESAIAPASAASFEAAAAPAFEQTPTQTAFESLPPQASPPAPQALPALPTQEAPLPDTQSRYQEPQPAPIQRTTIHKHIYVHVPPPEIEEPEPLPQLPQPVVNHNKHYKIIFIKAPSQPQAKLLPAPIPQNEEKTLVYVLVKKPDHAHQILQPLDQPAATPEKPEVYFIKYNAKKESAQAAAPALPALPAPQESSQLTGALVGEPRSKAPQFPALDENSELAQLEAKLDANEAAELTANASISVEAPQDAAKSSLPPKKYIPA